MVNTQTNKQIILKHANFLVPNYQVNKDLFNNLKSYFLGLDGKFNPNKGIFLMGVVGNGKTTIMKIFKNWLDEIQSSKRYNIHSIRRIEREYKIDGFKAIDYYSFRTQTNGYGIKEYHPENMCIDDVGTESFAIKNYGDSVNIFSELIADRYDLFIDKKIITHATTNIPAKKFKEIYSDERITSRLREMFNTVSIDEVSFRV